jgi:hypothetical protein
MVPLLTTDPDKAQDGYRRAFAQGSLTDYPLTLVHRDGTLTDMLYNATVYRDFNERVRVCWPSPETPPSYASSSSSASSCRRFFSHGSSSNRPRALPPKGMGSRSMRHTS